MIPRWHIRVNYYNDWKTVKSFGISLFYLVLDLDISRQTAWDKNNKPIGHITGVGIFFKVIGVGFYVGVKRIHKKGFLWH